MTIGAVIFDFGNVLVGWDPENLYRRRIPDAAERRHFLTHICSPAWNLEQDRGRPWAEAIDLLVAAHPQHADHIRAFYDEWDDMITGPVAEGHDILDRVLDAGIPAYEAALKANNKVYTVHIYENTQHGFHNDTTPRYDENAAKLAWSRSLEFFGKYLK